MHTPCQGICLLALEYLRIAANIPCRPEQFVSQRGRKAYRYCHRGKLLG